MTTLYAQPYDISANGFYFDSAEEYSAKVNTCRNSFGAEVEEFEIQFIDGESIDAALFDALSIGQCNFATFLEQIENLDDDLKTKIIIATGECGYSFELEKDCADDLDIEIYGLDSLCELAKEFVADGIFGEIPDNLQYYIDYDAIARDLAMDYSETVIAGERLVYRAS